MKLLLILYFILSSYSWAQLNPGLKNVVLNEQFKVAGVGESPIYEELERYYRLHHERVAASQLSNIEWGDDYKIWGGVNHIGLDFSKKFLDFSVSFRRQVAPDLFHDERYIVTDIMDIYIDASTFFEKLKASGQIEVPDQFLKAVAGLTFKRSYRFNHFADNYRDALTLNLDKLFFSYTYFRSKKAL